MSKAWLFQDSRQHRKLGDKKCPWSVGWLDPDGRRRSKRIGPKAKAEQERQKVVGVLTAVNLKTSLASPRSQTQDVRPCRAAIIGYPKRCSEFEVQAYLYSNLRRLGWDVRGEVRAPGGQRLDLVVFDPDHQAVLGIEVKRDGGDEASAFKQVRQYGAACGIRMLLLIGMEDARAYVEEAERGTAIGYRHPPSPG